MTDDDFGAAAFAGGSEREPIVRRRARLSSQAGMGPTSVQVLGITRKRTPRVALSDVRSAVIRVMLDERARRVIREAVKAVAQQLMQARPY